MACDIARLRALRRRVEERSAGFVQDLRPFIKTDKTFCRIPEKKTDPDVSVTTVCTGLMAAMFTGRLAPLYVPGAGSGEDPKEVAKEVFRKATDAVWSSSDL